MVYRLQIHISGEEPICLDVDDLPKPTDLFVMGTNPARPDGNPVHYVLHEVDQLIIPNHRISFIQVLSGGIDEEPETFVID
jgi:hypothetical protein